MCVVVECCIKVFKDSSVCTQSARCAPTIEKAALDTEVRLLSCAIRTSAHVSHTSCPLFLINFT